MPYMGAIKKGSQVSAELLVHNPALGTALLALMYANNANGKGSRAVSVLPGVTNQCALQTSPKALGMVRVLVDFKDHSDSGRLTVHVDGVAIDSAPITGDTTWVYAVA